MESPRPIVRISPVAFLGTCAVAAPLVYLAGTVRPFPAWALAAEVLATVVALFILGSIRYRLDKNALTYGAAMVIVATFVPLWRASRTEFLTATGIGWSDHLADVARRYLLSLHGWDRLVHADTILFILGLTFFVSAVAQTRLLETVSFAVLEKARGHLPITAGALTALVAAASGILDGVSMIGLMIRTLVILLFLAKVRDEGVVFAVMVSTVVTTVCGMWMAYGEPPNLIMKANLFPHLDSAFFLRYCLPAALGSYVIVYANIRRRLKGMRVDLRRLDILDRHTADVRFLQAEKHGDVPIPVEFIEENAADLGPLLAKVQARLHKGVPLGEALVLENVPRETRRRLLGDFLDETLAEDLDNHYLFVQQRDGRGADESARRVGQALDKVRQRRRAAQRVGGLSFVPFIGLLVAHAVNHQIPLFWASGAGFAVAVLGIANIPKTRRLAIREAVYEFREYLFLLPLFLSITLLQKTGFFDQAAALLQRGTEAVGHGPMAWSQFAGASVLSALLDNNVVADFAGRALAGLDETLIHLFAMAQIAGYALGGCWTHIGSAQSVVAYSFIQREVDPRYTPLAWIRSMTPVILQIGLFLTLLIAFESLLIQR